MAFWKWIIGHFSNGPDDPDRVEMAVNARLQYYRTLGPVVEDPQSPLELADPTQSPAWPDEPAWRRIRNHESTILVSDGLSNPFLKRSRKKSDVGFGIEILVESSDELPADYIATWLFHLLFQVSQNAAHHGGFRDLIDQHQHGVIEICSCPELADFQNAAGHVGVFLGLHSGVHHDKINYASGNALIVTAKLLTLPELNYAVGNGAIGYQLLRERFLTQGSDHRSSLKRESVI